MTCLDYPEEQLLFQFNTTLPLPVRRPRVDVVMNSLNLKPPLGSFSMILHVIILFWSFVVKSDFFNFLIGIIFA